MNTTFPVVLPLQMGKLKCVVGSCVHFNFGSFCDPILFSLSQQRFLCDGLFSDWSGLVRAEVMGKQMDFKKRTHQSCMVFCRRCSLSGS